jgi:hypothetical protein
MRGTLQTGEDAVDLNKEVQLLLINKRKQEIATLNQREKKEFLRKSRQSGE